MNLEHLKRLGYSQVWIDFNVLSEECLEEQIKEFKSSDDTNTEHYRYKTFKIFLANLECIENSLLNNLLDLIRIDLDESMAMSMGLDLLKYKKLKDHQFKIVSEFLLSTYGEQMKKYISKEHVYRDDIGI